MDKIVNLSLARKSVPTLIDVVQGATAPNIVFVLEDYTPPSNARARLYIKKTNAEVYNDCVLSGNQVTYTPTAGSFDEAGQCVAQLEIVQGSTIAVSWRIFVTVEPNLIEGSAAPASTEYGALESLIINAQQYDTIIGANNIVGANARQGWTALTTGQDLNTITTPGVYYTTSNANAQSLVNSPIAVQFKMTVEVSNGGTGRRQQIEAMSVQRDWAGQIWRRNTENTGSTWSDWIHIPLQSEVTAIANRSAKNLLQGMSGSSVTSNGITATKNADGSITLNGTATANFILVVGQFADTLNGERVTLTGCPEGGSGTTYVLRAYTEGTTIQNEYGSGVSFAVPNTNNFNVRIVIFKNTTVTDLTFYPMLRFESIQDDTYVPYGMTNAELTDTVNGTKFFAVAGNGTFLVPNNPRKYYILAWSVGNNYGGVNLIYTQSNALNSPLIATRGEGNAPSITLEGNDMQIKNNNTNTYIRCILIEAVKVLP